MIENLKKRKEIGPSAYPCSVAGFLSEMSRIIREADIKWGKCWDSSKFEEEAEALRFLAEDMKICVELRKSEQCSNTQA